MLYAQEPLADSVKTGGLKKTMNNIFHVAVNAVTKAGTDSATEAAILNAKSEIPFMPYEGKGIRHIFIQQFGFDKTFSDTANPIDYSGTKLLNRLHINTKEWVIRHNLFIKEKTALNAFMVADNERYLRSLEFMQDARILPRPITNEPDSIDLLVVTKDLFSLTADLGELTTNRLKGKIGDANVMGMGQKLELTALFDEKRSPAFGYQVLYTKNSIANSFINATVAVTTINTDLAYRQEAEKAFYVKLDRPLVSLYSHTAGSLIIGANQSENNYTKPDSSFYNYHYNTYDAWYGYNLGVRKVLQDNRIKRRLFVGLRYFNYHFTDVPVQIGNQFNPHFNSRQAVLGQATFFKQEFYKTNYIYGFGTTEDVPYGYNISFTGGWYKQLYLERPYAGIDANKSVVSKQGEFAQYFLRSGMFLHNGHAEDASILIGASYFSKLFLWNNLKIRQYLRMSYTRLFNRIGYEPLKINNPFGLRYFNADSVYGNRRASLHTETFFFLKRKLLGFHFAPFTFADISMLAPEGNPLSKSDMYYGIGGGVRTRNENLVFGTIEIRAIYFPRKVLDFNQFKIEINTQLNFRYNSNYVRAPDIIQLNSDYTNSIY